MICQIAMGFAVTILLSIHMMTALYTPIKMACLKKFCIILLLWRKLPAAFYVSSGKRQENFAKKSSISRFQPALFVLESGYTSTKTGRVVNQPVFLLMPRMKLRSFLLMITWRMFKLLNSRIRTIKGSIRPILFTSKCHSLPSCQPYG